MDKPSDFLELQLADNDEPAANKINTKGDKDGDHQELNSSDDDDSLSVIQLRGRCLFALGVSPLIFRVEIISQQDFFEDMVAMVKPFSTINATQVTENLTVLYSRERDYYMTEVQKPGMCLFAGAHQNTYSKTRYIRLKRIVAGLIEHKGSVIDYLLYRANDSSVSRRAWQWDTHDEIPVFTERISSIHRMADLALSIPQVLILDHSRTPEFQRANKAIGAYLSNHMGTLPG